MNQEESKSFLIEINRAESEQRDKTQNRRENRRVSVRAEAILHRVDRHGLTRQPIEASLRDIGTTGAGLLANEQIQLGTVWRCEFLKADHVIGSQCIRIRYCEPVNGSGYLIGGLFVIDPAIPYLLDVEDDLTKLCNDEVHDAA